MTSDHSYDVQTSYLSPISPIIYVEKKFPCGEFSAFHVWRLQGNKKILYMWRNFRCLPMTDVEKSEILHIWHVCDVENVAIYAKFMLFSWKISFVKIYALCREIRFVVIYALLCGEKFIQKISMWRKKWQISRLMVCRSERNWRSKVLFERQPILEYKHSTSEFRADSYHFKPSRAHQVGGDTGVVSKLSPRVPVKASAD